MAHVLAELKILPKVKCTEAVALAQELGLELQAKRYEKPLAENTFKPLSADESGLWGFYCPTRYVQGGGENVRALEQYGFDSVPVEVMRHWKAIKDNYAFDRYEVWTTERTQRTSDPLLIGVIGQNLYLLARWGMESPESMPLAQIAKDYHDGRLQRLTEMWAWRWPLQTQASATARASKRALGYLVHYDRLFAASRRILGLSTDIKMYQPGYD